MFVVVFLMEKKFTCYTFYDVSGDIIQPKHINEEFLVQLDKVCKIRPDLIPIDLDISEVYNIQRSLRRGSVAMAREESVGKDAVDKTS